MGRHRDRLIVGLMTGNLPRRHQRRRWRRRCGDGIDRSVTAAAHLNYPVPPRCARGCSGSTSLNTFRADADGDHTEFGEQLALADAVMELAGVWVTKCRSSACRPGCIDAIAEVKASRPTVTWRSASAVVAERTGRRVLVGGPWPEPTSRAVKGRRSACVLGLRPVRLMHHRSLCDPEPGWHRQRDFPPSPLHRRLCDLLRLRAGEHGHRQALFQAHPGP